MRSGDRRLANIAADSHGRLSSRGCTQETVEAEMLLGRFGQRVERRINLPSISDLRPLPTQPTQPGVPLPVLRENPMHVDPADKSIGRGRAI